VRRDFPGSVFGLRPITLFPREHYYEGWDKGSLTLFVFNFFIRRRKKERKIVLKLRIKRAGLSIRTNTLLKRITFHQKTPEYPARRDKRESLGYRQPRDILATAEKKEE